MTLTPQSMQSSIHATIMHNGPIWVDNIRRNLGKYLHDLSTLPERPRKRAVLCASGPSLTNDIHEIKRLRESVDIYCSPTNYSFLRAHGVTPDFLVSVDGHGAQHRSLGVQRVPAETTLLLSAYASPGMVTRAEQGADQIYWFKSFLQGPRENPMNDQYGLNRFLTWLLPELKSAIVQAGCVGNALLLVLELLSTEGIVTYDKVHLAGYDFGYTDPQQQRVQRYTLENDQWTPGIQRDDLRTKHGEHFSLERDGEVLYTDELSMHYVHSLCVIWPEILKGINIQRMSGRSLAPIPVEESYSTVQRANAAEAWYQWAKDVLSNGTTKVDNFALDSSPSTGS